MPIGQFIAPGTTADVYAWSEDRVLKLFHADQSRERVDYEAFIGRTVAEAGVAAPRVFDVIQENGRWGIVYERVLGKPLDKASAPWGAARSGQQMARMHATLFSQHVPTLPRQRDVLITRVGSAPYLSEADHRRLLTLLETLPDGDVLCHGDFHPSNLMQTADGLKIIDWNDAKQGHPTADIARTLLILEEVHALGDLYLSLALKADVVFPRWFLRIALWVFRRAIRSMIKGYRHEIERLVPEARALIPRWIPVLAAARLHEGQYADPTAVPSDAPPEARTRMIERMVGIARQDATLG